MLFLYRVIISFLFVLSVNIVSVYSQSGVPAEFSCRQQVYKTHPEIYDEAPGIPSPYKAENGREYVTEKLKDGRWTIYDVTVEKGEPYCQYCGNWGKGDQSSYGNREYLRTGLFDEEEISGREHITGIPIHVINYTAKPGAYSHSGFIAEDEDILSVIKGDNRVVKRLGLTHPEMANPLFHVWNLPLIGPHNESKNMLYNGSTVFITGSAGKGHQKSIFHDSIIGRWNLNIWREFSEEELVFLGQQYSKLNSEEFTELLRRLSRIETGEMVPFYVTRYGFYEGHTDFRADPIAIAFIFGLKSIEEIEAAFPGELYEGLTEHYTE